MRWVSADCTVAASECSVSSAHSITEGDCWLSTVLLPPWQADIRSRAYLRAISTEQPHLLQEDP